jgi:hypothetical protein
MGTVVSSLGLENVTDENVESASRVPSNKTSAEPVHTGRFSTRPVKPVESALAGAARPTLAPRAMASEIRVITRGRRKRRTEQMPIGGKGKVVLNRCWMRLWRKSPDIQIGN